MAADLVPDLVERLRVERESALAHYFDEPLLRYANSALVRALAELSRDTSRSLGFRRTAVRTLGTTAHSEALPVLVDLWADDDTEMRIEASRAFTAIVPFVRTREQAVQLLADMAESGVPLVEVLRRRLRLLEAAAAMRTEGDYRSEYVEIALAALPHLPLGEVVEFYLDAPVPSLRQAATERMGTIDWDSEPDPGLARIRVGKALLAALSREEDSAVERAILATLVPLARSIQDHVGREAMAALMQRATASGGATRDVRVASIKFLGALRDPRPVARLQHEFDALGDTDPDLRIELLKAFAPVAVDLTRWLRDRVLSETDQRVAEDMVVELLKKNDPDAVSTLDELLARSESSEILRHHAIAGLVNLWANHGIAAACDVLIERGLNDDVVTVRETSAHGLGNRASDDPRLLAALEGVVLRPTEEDSVRAPAARSILNLDSEGALQRLMPVLAVEAIWDVYRDRRVDDLRAGEIDVSDVLAEADTLWTAPDPETRERAVLLLQAVVDAGNGLWEGAEGRGFIHERLASRLLESGRPEHACQVAEALLAGELRADDPEFRWRFLLARSLRACGASDPLRRAVRELTSLRTSADLPPALKIPVLLELGDTQLQLDDPTGALESLVLIDDLAELSVAERNRHAELAALAQTRSDEEKRLVLQLLTRPTEPEARRQLGVLGYRAARHLKDALDDEMDIPRLRRLMAAIEVISGRPFELPDEITTDDLEQLRFDARAALQTAIETRQTRGER